MFTCRLHLEDGSDVGEASYPSMVKVGEELFFGGGRRFRVLDVVPIDDEDAKYVGLLRGRGGVAHAPRRWEAHGRMLRKGERSRLTIRTPAC
jgi:hypothetical protein